MPDSLTDRLRQIEEEKNRWFRERNAQAMRIRRELEDTGKLVWNAATRAGTDLQARTTAELQALGLNVLDSRRRTENSSPHPSPTRPRAQTISGDTSKRESLKSAKPSNVNSPTALPKAVRQADAAMRAAANVVSLGAADHLSAGMNALLEPGGIQEFGKRYADNLAEEAARNRSDARDFPLPRALGIVGGTALGMRIVGSRFAPLAAVPRIPGAASLSGRELAALLGGGAATGLGVQTVYDAVTGKRSSFGDLTGATIGGMAGAAALPFGPGQAGAIDGLVTSVSQDVLNGRRISLEHAGQSVVAGNALGGLTGGLGRRLSDDLPMKAKGRLGEAMGGLRSAIDGVPRDVGAKARDYLSDGSYWYPDARSGRIRFEDKFGFDAELSKNQTRAQSELGSDFRLYHFTPDDIGALFSLPPGAAAAPLSRREEARRN